MRGLLPGRSSRTTSRTTRSSASRPGRRSRKDEVESGTIEQALPGLEVAPTRPELKVGHAIALTPQKRLMVFSGRSHPELAGRIAEQLDVELGEVELETFANGESYCRYIESIRGADIFVVQTGSEPVDRNLMRRRMMLEAARPAWTKRVPR